MSRITQKHIAIQLGLNQATVSRALSGTGRVSEALRQYIRKAAEQMGYRPDPVLSSLNAYRRTKQPIKRGHTLVWFGSRPPGREGSFEQMLFKAAQARADELGYGMGYVWGEQPGYTPKRYAQIFKARGVAGVVFAPREAPHSEINLEIKDFAAVAIGRSVDWPPVDRVSPDHFQTMETCYASVWERGFRRIGFAMTESYSERIAGLWIGAFLRQQLRYCATAAKQSMAIPPYLNDDMHNPEPFAAWYKKWQPDAILTMGWHYGCITLLQQMGVRYPRDVGLALMVVPRYDSSLAGYSGITEPVGELGSFCVDVLAERIRNNMRGAGSSRRVHLLPGNWHEGNSLR